MQTLEFDNRFIRELPGDPDTSVRPRQVTGACWSPVQPTPVAAPRLIAYSPEVAAALGLTAADVRDPRFAEVFAGNALLPGMAPWAACYGGHQFGNWAGQLGDGRAISLGEALGADGNRHELQLKGAGPTPYSRMADGRAVLRSSLREFLCSEAMHHLGVPTTRALSLVLTGEEVVRDMFYDGHPRAEPGAIVCRVAPSFIRLGNFELFAARGERDLLARLVDFTIRRDFPELDPEAPDCIARWFEEVCVRTARLIAHWMRVGFVHGVMNTDNLSILGLTIDYGPYGWLEDVDPNWTPNTTDAHGRRYAFGRQPEIGQWNLLCLARALASLVEDPEPLRAALERYVEVYSDEYRRMHAAKLGLREITETDVVLVQQLYRLMQQAEVDFTLAFRALADVDPAHPSPAPLESAFYREDLRARHADAWQDWLDDYAARIRQDALPAAERRESMASVNPRYVLRNWLAQQAIDQAEQGDYTMVGELMEVLRRPYDDQPGREAFAARRPEWARHRAGCSMLSCSS
ncbi:MAG: YdiU family protein [Gammaproteobacteria bacterium]|nr:YdiU family protein [Gammaproteobacteria bacterium]TVQ47924.1 MAG: YdiU family protein [Gammaproteobacteria bacterium]